MKNNRIKGIVGLMDITKRFSWDSRHEFPVNTLDSFIFDKEYASCAAQYATSNGTPFKKWEKVTWMKDQILLPDDEGFLVTNIEYQITIY